MRAVSTDYSKSLECSYPLQNFGWKACAAGGWPSSGCEGLRPSCAHSNGSCRCCHYASLAGCINQVCYTRFETSGFAIKHSSHSFHKGHFQGVKAGT